MCYVISEPPPVIDEKKNQKKINLGDEQKGTVDFFSKIHLNLKISKISKFTEYKNPL